jgi:hypothetical protein
LCYNKTKKITEILSITNQNCSHGLLKQIALREFGISQETASFHGQQTLKPGLTTGKTYSAGHIPGQETAGLF